MSERLQLVCYIIASKMVLSLLYMSKVIYYLLYITYLSHKVVHISKTR